MSSDLPAATTHAWTDPVDVDHLAAVRADAATYGAGGLAHLVLEVLAYADEEAAALGRTGTVLLTRHTDGSVSVADDGRGTAVHRRPDGTIVRKPVLATKDLRFFDADTPPTLPDGRPRRGMSVVAALSTWAIHTNRRVDGGWRQRYARGLPVGDLEDLPAAPGTGTTVQFQPDRALVHDAGTLAPTEGFAHLRITLG